METPITQEVTPLVAPEVSDITPETVVSENPVVTEPEMDIFNWMSEEELTTAIAEAMWKSSESTPTEPTSFKNKDDVTTEDPNDLSSEIERLNNEIIWKVDLEAEIETLKDELTQKTEHTNQIEEAWASLTTEIPDLQDILTWIVAKSDDAVPLHYKKENWERVASNKVIWPLVLSLLKWEDLNIPEFVKSLTASRVNAMPRTSATSKEPTDVPSRSVQNAASILTKNRKTISIT